MYELSRAMVLLLDANIEFIMTLPPVQTFDLDTIFLRKWNFVIIDFDLSINIISFLLQVCRW